MKNAKHNKWCTFIQNSSESETINKFDTANHACHEVPVCITDVVLYRKPFLYSDELPRHCRWPNHAEIRGPNSSFPFSSAHRFAGQNYKAQQRLWKSELLLLLDAHCAVLPGPSPSTTHILLQQPAMSNPLQDCKSACRWLRLSTCPPRLSQIN